MTENRANKEYDFEIQQHEAKKAEAKLKDLILTGKFELKTESNLWHDKGNIVIEYESYDEPSGLAATKADYWAHELRTKDKQTLAYIIFPTPVLKKICNDLMEEGGNWRRGGENNAMEMVLLEVGGFLGRLRNFSGQGDEVFLTRKMRKTGTKKKANAEK